MPTLPTLCIKVCCVHWVNVDPEMVFIYLSLKTICMDLVVILHPYKSMDGPKNPIGSHRHWIIALIFLAGSPRCRIFGNTFWLFYDNWVANQLISLLVTPRASVQHSVNVTTSLLYGDRPPQVISRLCQELQSLQLNKTQDTDANIDILPLHTLNILFIYNFKTLQRFSNDIYFFEDSSQKKELYFYFPKLFFTWKPPVVSMRSLDTGSHVSRSTWMLLQVGNG